ETHEDSTVRTESPFGSAEDAPPAMAALGPSAPNIEIDVSLTGAFAPVDADATIQTEPLSELEIPSSPPPPAPKAARSSSLWLGVLLGALITALIAGGVGWLVVAQ